MSHILIDAETRQPVPLPFFCEYAGGSFVINDFTHNKVIGRLQGCFGNFHLLPDVMDPKLNIVTEADFIKERFFNLES